MRNRFRSDRDKRQLSLVRKLVDKSPGTWDLEGNGIGIGLGLAHSSTCYYYWVLINPWQSKQPPEFSLAEKLIQEEEVS